MSHRSLAAVLSVVAIGWLVSVPPSAQGQDRPTSDTASTWTMPRTPDGHPDLQGLYTTQTFTSLERPEHLGDKEFEGNYDVRHLLEINRNLELQAAANAAQGSK